MNNGRKESKRGSQVDCFFLFVYIPLFLRIVSLSTYFAFEKWDKYTFWSNKKTLTSICTDCKTLHVDATIFIS